MNNEKSITQSQSARRKTIVDVMKRWQLYLMLLPALVYTLLFSYKPMYGILIAFQDYR